MRKLYRGIAECSFGEYGHFHLPALMNHHGVTLAMFKSAQLRDKPEFTKVVINFLEPETKYALRHYLKRHPKADGRDLLRRATTTTESARHLIDQISRLANDMIESQRLYERDGQVRTEIRGSFSYNDHYVDHTSDYYSDYSCPDCGSTETGVAEGLDPSQFTHLSGPYFRCEACGNVCRPDVEQSTEEYYDEHEWEDYVEHLDSLLDTVMEEISSRGLPAPDYLHVSGRNLDWRGRSGYTTCPIEGEALARAMSVNSAFSITNGELIVPKEGTPFLTCGMSHHDASGSMKVRPMWACELSGYSSHRDLGEDEMVVGDEIYQAQIYAKMANALLCGSAWEFEYAPNANFRAVSQVNLEESISHLAGKLEMPEDHWLYTLLDSFDPTKREVFEAEALRGAIEDYIKMRELEAA